jgi:beta-lactamase superfamily II metal-dependent hydrolase
MVYSLPASNEAEVTLLGTGGGYGESSVVHYGNGFWAIIDSCSDPKNNIPIPIEYLTKLGVDLKNAVKLIICTHWHNDHIIGLSQVVDECKSADFCFGKANDKKKFLYWVTLDYQKMKDNSKISSTSEFVKCLEILNRDKSRKVKPAYPDRILDSIPNIHTSIAALSPSDFVIEEFDKEVSTLIANFGGPQKKYVYQSPNEQSVVLLITLGHHSVILGADLEVFNDNRKGWLNILDYSKVATSSKSSLFKIPHHGSENGYHQRILDELLNEDPILKLTPWNRNKCLPEPEMIRLYKTLSKNLYITSPVIKHERPKKRSKELEKIINFFNQKLKEVKYTNGIIQSRIVIDDPSATWTTQLDGEAFNI